MARRTIDANTIELNGINGHSIFKALPANFGFHFQPPVDFEGCTASMVFTGSGEDTPTDARVGPSLVTASSTQR